MRELAPRGAVRTWLVRTDTGDADRTCLLDDTERGRAEAFRFERDRSRYVAAHLALRQILAEVVGSGMEELRFGRLPCTGCGEPHGRPVLPDFPGTHFSLSRSGDMALVAVAAVPVGADVEELPSDDVPPELIGALHPSERAEIAALDELRARGLGTDGRAGTRQVRGSGRAQPGRTVTRPD